MKKPVVERCFDLLIDLKDISNNIWMKGAVEKNGLKENMVRTLKDMGYIIEEPNTHPKRFKFIWNKDITLEDASKLRFNYNKHIRTNYVIPSQNRKKQGINRLYIDKKDVNAISEKGITVLKGSTAVKDVSDTFPNHRKRNELINSGVLVDIGNCYRFDQDYTFNSKSQSSSIILGRRSNGNVDWEAKSDNKINVNLTKNNELEIIQKNVSERLDYLERLAKLKFDGILTDNEFQREKKIILG